MLPLFITAAALQAVSGPPVSAADRYHRCLEAATQRPAEGETEAIRWKAAGGGVHARPCLGVALANQQRWMGRSEERRVGKECVLQCRSRVWPTHSKKQKYKHIE